MIYTSEMDKLHGIIQSGNAEIDSAETRGWFIGNFLDEECGLGYTTGLEIKWGNHVAGESRKEWATDETRTTLGLLISGEFEMEFRGRKVKLSNPGDYVMWGSGVDHKWQALNNCTFLTVRWEPAHEFTQE